MQQKIIGVVCVAVILSTFGAAYGESSPYAKWKRGMSADASFFPICVWLQNPRNARKYKEAGINTYIGLWKGPTDTQLAELKRAGMKVICNQNKVGLAHGLQSARCIAGLPAKVRENRQHEGEWACGRPAHDASHGCERLARGRESSGWLLAPPRDEERPLVA